MELSLLTNEVEALKTEGFVIIKIECSTEERIARMKKNKDNFSQEDYVIGNNGSLKDLYIQFCNL
ncbi:hypothetical protein GNF82_13615 [Clostridium perfringens]